MTDAFCFSPFAPNCSCCHDADKHVRRFITTCLHAESQPLELSADSSPTQNMWCGKATSHRSVFLTALSPKLRSQLIRQTRSLPLQPIDRPNAKRALCKEISTLSQVGLSHLHVQQKSPISALQSFEWPRQLPPISLWKCAVLQPDFV